MTRFSDTRNDNGAFAAAAESGGPLHLWRPGEPVVAEGTRLLIGVAVYSPAELAVLDLIADRLAGGHAGGVRVDVFDVASCRSQEQLDEYVPGVRPVTQTPVVGVWRDGVLTDRASGFAARVLLGRTLGVSDELEALVADHYESLARRTREGGRGPAASPQEWPPPPTIVPLPAGEDVRR